MSLANHLVETYEDRKTLHPPQNVQRSAASHASMQAQQHNSRAGPSTYHGANAAHGQQVQQQQQQQGGEGHGNWANHGMPWWMAMPPHLRAPQQTLTPWSEERVAQMQVRLARKLGPEYVTQRPGPGGGPKLSYIEGWKVINLANEVFGFSGWSSSIVSLVTDFIDVNEQGRCSISVSAQVRITLRDGAYHEDIGSGQAENVRGKASALDKAKKEAVTDATKRALRNFGNVLGNCLYDKSFTANVSKMKVPAPKWNPDELERRPEFTPAGGIKPPQVAPQHQPQQYQQSAPAPAPAPAPISNPPTQQAAQWDMPRAGTPLRSLNDSIVADQSVNITMDENFDAEFLDDSFFDMDADGEISRMMDAPVQDKQANSGPSRPAQQQQSAAPPAAPYTHRHRPDASTNSGPSRSSTSGPSVGTSGPSRSSTSGPAFQTHGQLSTSGPSRQTEMQPPAIPDETPARSSGTSSTTVESGPVRTRPVGVAPPERPASNNAGSSARAAAIAAASRDLDPAPTTLPNTSTSTHQQQQQRPNNSAAQSHSTPHHPRVQVQTGPIRSESPRIPDGGVDAVAARAASARNFRLNAARLELDSGIGTDESPGGGMMTYGGFSSARGMKRVISGGANGPGGGGGHEDRNVSPSKQNIYQPQGTGQVQRNGPRRALGEIEIPDPDWDDRAKRQRAM